MKPIKIYYKEGYKYQLYGTVQVQLKYTRPRKDCFTKYIYLNTQGYLFIYTGYAWDGATGAKDTKSIMPGSLVHDALYELMRKGQLPRKWREAADKDFRRINRLCKMNGVRSKYVYRAVRRFGRPATLASHKKKVLTAP